jgi:hypothetical protein
MAADVLVTVVAIAIGGIGAISGRVYNPAVGRLGRNIGDGGIKVIRVSWGSSLKSPVVVVRYSSVELAVRLVIIQHDRHIYGVV